MNTKEYDLIILGGGIGGYTAAIRAAQAGRSAAIVERDKLGGTCLHRGCIPSKALLRSAEVYAQMKESERYGIVAESVSVDFAKVMSRKDGIVEQLYNGVQYLMKKNKIDVYVGNGRVIGPSIFSPRSGAIAIDTEDEETPTLVGKNTLIATGSRPRSLPGLAPDGVKVLTSDDALKLAQLPASMLIVGGGVIGVEWASMLNDFGVSVTIVEAAPRLLPQEDEEISRELARLFKKRGIRVITGASFDAGGVDVREDGVAIALAADGEPDTVSAEKCLVSVGRAANIEGIGLENTDVITENGFIRVNEFMQTNEKHIYAVGDVAGGLQLAHKAGHEAILAVDHMLERPVHRLETNRIPRCIYTRPEIAAIGLTEQEAVKRGYRVKKGKVSFKAIGKALVYGETDGFAKVIADRDTDDVLGVHLIGPHVTEHISEAGLAALLEAAAWEVGAVIRPHPTLSEALGEAMLAADGIAIGI
jgi:dihydrolipoamide dehydrogenase